LFAVARQLDGERRTAFLRENCGQDHGLYQLVWSLLDIDGQPGLLDSKPTAPTFCIPQVVAGRFRIIRYIAEGGMGAVYEAEDLQLHDQVALKTIRPDIASNPQVVERFKQEIKLGKRVTHPNVCRIHDLGIDRSENGTEFLFLTMQFLNGESLSSRIRRGPVPQREALPLIEDLADALSAAHQAGVIHRDFKSGNVILVPGAHRTCAVVTDFGLARGISDGASLTRSGLAGTPDYMAPEQITGDDITAATDIYAFGVVMYEMVTGQLPFTGDSKGTVIHKHLHDEPQPPRELAPHLEPDWEDAILDCLKKLPGERFQSAAEVKEVVQGGIKPDGGRQRGERWRKLAGITVIAVTLAAALVSVGVWYLHRGSKFRERDTIVLADFDNRTGESDWDATFKLVLTKDLQDSPYLNVLPDQTVRKTLKLMKRRPDERLTQDLAKEVCLRNSKKALLTPSIAKMGAQYHLDLRAMNCATGELLASADAEADTREKVIAALKNASNQLRQKLGESLISVQEPPPRPPSTALLEASQEYATGLKMKAAQGSGAAVQYFKRAIELDPEFADAYAALGAAYNDLGDDALWIENSRKAYELRDRATDGHERFHIEGEYYDSVTGEKERAHKTYLNWINVYPDDYRPHQNLGMNYFDMGQYDKAVDEAKMALHLEPNNVNAFTSLMGDYLALGQLEKANDTFEQARKAGLDQPALRLYRYYTAFLESDGETMQKQLEWAMGQPGAEDLLLSAASDTEAFYGRFDRARGLTRRAAQSAKNADMAETAAGWKANAALRGAEVGNKVQARAIATDALQMSRGRDVELQVALALARAGQPAQAERIVAKLDTEYSHSTMMQNYWLPTIRAAIELQNKNANRAIELLEETIPYELGEGLQGHMYPTYLRGEAYLMLGRGDQAAAEFQKVLEYRGVVLNFVIGSLARLQLARAAALRGDTAAARKNYEDFLGLWKGADADLHLLSTAQNEYKRLPSANAPGQRSPAK
jgi:serine/threonine protein kinase/Tfp pilus assembly protein PilF